MSTRGPDRLHRTDIHTQGTDLTKLRKSISVNPTTPSPDMVPRLPLFKGVVPEGRDRTKESLPSSFGSKWQKSNFSYFINTQTGWEGEGLDLIWSCSWEEAIPPLQFLFPEERKRGAMWVEITDVRHSLSTKGDRAEHQPPPSPRPQDATAHLLSLCRLPLRSSSSISFFSPLSTWHTTQWKSWCF